MMALSSNFGFLWFRIGLGTLLSGARFISDGMLQAAAEWYLINTFLACFVLPNLGWKNEITARNDWCIFFLNYYYHYICYFVIAQLIIIRLKG